ncbi:MAG: LysM peptidoglycan-binding domain-containing protein, partial [Candidatus Rokubacteria bacterium]|nr:LysM peptidoglycan-binding domain-containing protein [Candidatus Rokubacteria bacterium]
FVVPVAALGLALAEHAASESAEEAAAPAVAPAAEAAATAAPASPAESSVEASEAASAPEVAPAAEVAVPAEPPAAGQESEAAQGGSEQASGVTLGPVGYDAEGRPGRIHLVVPGDTLWDISEAYLATPWVWPSIWRDNDQVENPHRIYPGDRIWITPSEMRRVSPAEAEALLAGQPAEELPASLEDAHSGETTGPAPSYPVGSIEAMGLVTFEQLEGAASLVESPHERVWLAEHDTVFVGLGQGEVSPGDELTVFRATEKVVHPETGEPFGYHVDVLGWVRVEEVKEEVAVAGVRQSFSEMRRGDRVLPRQELAAQVQLLPSRSPIEGQILFMPDSRRQMASADVVYLDRGAVDGLAVGNV